MPGLLFPTDARFAFLRHESNEDSIPHAIRYRRTPPAAAILGLLLALWVTGAALAQPPTTPPESSPAAETADESAPPAPDADDSPNEDAPPADAASSPDEASKPDSDATSKTTAEEDLGRAIQLRLNAQTLNELGEVIQLCQSALRKGLSDEDTKFAQRLLGAALMQRANVITQALFNAANEPERGPQLAQLREMAINDLQQAVKNDPEQSEVYYLLGKLYSLSSDDSEKAVAALDEAVNRSADNPDAKAKALQLRATVQSDPEKRRADLNAAIELAPRDAPSLRARGLLAAEQGDFAAALADLDAAVEADPNDADNYEARGLTYLAQQKLAEAAEDFGRAIEREPTSPVPRMQRARVYLAKGDFEDAIADLDAVLELLPGNPLALLLRSAGNVLAGHKRKAEADLEASLELRPGRAQALRTRGGILLGAKHTDLAIADLEAAHKEQPNNAEVLIELAILCASAKQPQRAVEYFTAALDVESDNLIALQGRADSQLTMGHQTEAIADYEAVLKVQPKNSAVLNNLAWVLATSTDDTLRNGSRAIELATQACEITEYKQAHILSTLAAGYAETGDFAKAREWSQKAVDSGSAELQTALRRELASYEHDKPWREKQSPSGTAGGSAGEELTPLPEPDQQPPADSTSPTEPQP